MASTLLDQVRQTHEDIEMLERAVVYNLDHKAKTHRERLMQDHRVRGFVEKIKVMSGELLEKHRDADGSLREEVASMKGEHVFKNFYERLTSIRDYHARFPASSRAVADPATQAVQAAEPKLTFSGEECVGRFLDLQHFHERYCNFPGVRVDYQGFLDKVADLASFPLKHKNMEYATFVEDVAAYLRGFFERTTPLVALAPLMSRLRAQFDKEWKAGELPGWGAAADGADDSGSKPADDLFCAPCNRRFTKATVFAAHKGSKKHKRVVARQAASGAGNGGGEAAAGASAAADGAGGGRESTHMRCAWAELQVRRMLELLSDVMDATKRQVEKKQTRTFQELEAEIEAAEKGDEDSDLEDSDDEEKVLYNPKNLPLGWDGKPIPYWLYKLHGLNMKFKCEICGNHTYCGRRDFDRHFREWRHAQGMRALGIPNTKHFHDIVMIDDAVNLYKKLKEGTQQVSWKAEEEEEFEDADGNVLSRKMYDDMVREGIIQA